jgi:hypothetical protein
MDNKGQSALFDAILFLVIMIVASGIISVFADEASKSASLSQRDDMMGYARDTSEVVLAATLNSTWYEDENGDIISKPPGNTKVMNIILEELYLLNSGVPSHNFALGYERDIRILIRNLVTSSYHFALVGTFTGSESGRENKIFISDIMPDYSSKEDASSDGTDYSQNVPKDDLASISYTQPMIGNDGEAELSFLLWR